MSDAASQLARIVQLVAEGSRSADVEDGAETLSALAARYGVPPKQIAADIRTLTLLGDYAGTDWLLSLRVWQQEDRVSVSSVGPYRRPVTLAPDEVMALRVALVMDPDGLALVERLSTLLAEDVPIAAEDRPADRSIVVLSAARARAKIEVRYASASGDTHTFTLHPHQVIGYRGFTYVVAWCEEVERWRHLRVDRMLTARATGESFEQRHDFEPVRASDDVFRTPEDGVDDVEVRFDPHIARWIRERYPRSVGDADGSVTVTFQVASPEWLVRRVLEYGDGAEVVAPAGYREAVRAAVGAREN